jgi:hypothetical protein
MDITPIIIANIYSFGEATFLEYSRHQHINLWRNYIQYEYVCMYQNKYQELTLEHELSIPELNLLEPVKD